MTLLNKLSTTLRIATRSTRPSLPSGIASTSRGVGTQPSAGSRLDSRGDPAGVHSEAAAGSLTRDGPQCSSSRSPSELSVIAVQWSSQSPQLR